MRIDYFLVSEQLKDRIVSCKMHGRGIELEGAPFMCSLSHRTSSSSFAATWFLIFFFVLSGFYGSDHCPVSLELSKPSSYSEENQVSN